ncbi:MAG: ribonuclease P protein component [Candidatus Zambryskibacteria bacterium RIFCSPHIGHO2_01_FULL_49_18]|uniref:Ribonuclease P protein component n=2 Tax=Candidatus Zambryskiibacteriota TaxID=1817925 RepID=A0A1G2T2V2_9BACT|nr:MAG: ribonuclease P protein component [Candidatus Zambryskibacteria bacterium RIFCSPHIGHO2_01_FULL_49_18]OHB05912.1 MAG: ribonuclease P protein component [Candidatus Zambryskibacteria bacterium RIFCSPLOWO2_01_FULL_47_14]
MLHFSVRFVKDEKNKIIISVSKKISKKAVIRNTIKRRVRAVLRDLKPVSCLIIAKPGAENIKGKELESELKSLVVSRRL